MDTLILVGKRIKGLRNGLDISQEKLADITQLDRTYITSAEWGRRNISTVNIDKYLSMIAFPR